MTQRPPRTRQHLYVIASPSPDQRHFTAAAGKTQRWARQRQTGSVL